MLKTISDQMLAAGLRERSAQMAMIESVYQAIKDKKFFCVEAPTGTGKTLAYCLAALQARENNQPLIISTATTALQEQFFQKDLLLIEKILGQKLSVALAKGRRRYVCHARLFNAEEFVDDANFNAEVKLLQDLLQKKKWQGESDKLTIKIDPALWQKISTDASGCSAGRCEYFDDCIFFQNRRKIYSADIVVVNHSLLLSDLELGGGVILPDMKDSIYIIDECHHLPEKALSHFAKQAAVLRSFDWINNIGKTLTKVVTHIKVKQQTTEDLNLYVKDLVEALRQVKQYVDQYASDFSEEQWRVKSVDAALMRLAENITQQTKKIFQIIEKFLQQLDEVYEKHKDVNKVEAEVVTHLQASLGFIADRAENLLQTWQDLIAHGDEKNKVPMACWFEKMKTREGVDYTLHTSPINVSEALQKLFWDKLENSAILCSATVRAMGSFNDFFRRVGLKNHPKAIEKMLHSPFEHQHSIFFVPNMKFEPTQQQQDQHLQEMSELLPQLVLPKHGSLVLFTSRKAMELMYHKMPAALKKNILMQDSQNKMELINLHKRAVDKDQQSVIFGLASFAEGIDLPGAYCQHVIIQKIPFSVPSDPISQTRSEWLKKHNADPFQLVTLPETSIKLAQYMGRLLRHEDDRGIVTILDKRLITKAYGKSLMASLPAFTPLLNVTVEEFFAHPLVERFYTHS